MLEKNSGSSSTLLQRSTGSFPARALSFLRSPPQSSPPALTYPSLAHHRPFMASRRGDYPVIPLKEIAPAAANNISTKFILLDKGKRTMEGQTPTCLTLVADETASVHFQLWGDECDAFQPGDIILLTNGIFSPNRGGLILRAGKRGRIEKVGEFTMAYVETPNMSEIRWVADPNKSNRFMQEAVVSPFSRIFPPQH